MPFLCFDLIVVKHKATWEQAIWHCRQTHSTLASLSSETEHLLALNKIQREIVTERVWIGLRYMVDHWRWVDGNHLAYQAWNQEGDQRHQCPKWNRCGALSKSELWESWDCQEKLNFIC
ncbi:dromaiocalcin-1-like [Chaetodon trifascialis]|uniref:dromaiocalcin-1-like n=1 Tax=Chaetodon trifascialis TaxID=109706 RepID=UPI003990FC8A